MCVCCSVLQVFDRAQGHLIRMSLHHSLSLITFSIYTYLYIYTHMYTHVYIYYYITIHTQSYIYTTHYCLSPLQSMYIAYIYTYIHICIHTHISTLPYHCFNLYTSIHIYTYIQPIQLGWHVRKLLQSSKLKARTSLFTETWQKRRSSFELWALKQHSKMSPRAG